MNREQTEADNHTAAATRPEVGNRPGAATRPAAGNRPGAATQTEASNRSEAAAQTEADNRPGAATRPAAGNRPGAVAQPDAGNRARVVAQTAAGNRPGAATRPAAGNRPGAATRPDADNRARGIAQTEADNHTAAATRPAATTRLAAAARGAVRIARRHPLWLALPLAALSLAAAILSLARGHALFIGIVLVLLSMVPFLWRFERRERQSRELVLIASMAAVASVSRIPFAALLPSFTPVTFVVIVSGVVFGAEAGWMVGAVTGLVSNFFLGQGPWTPWQMFGWSMAGYTAGLFAHRRPLRRRRLPLILFGAVWSFGFSWLMNVSVALDVWVKEQSWPAVAAVYALSLPFDIVHAAASIFFIAVFAPSWIQLLERYRRKYGALERIEAGIAGEEESAYGQRTAADR